MKKLPQQQAFSLIELLVVLAIIAIMGAIVAPAIVSSVRGSQLSQASQQVINELNFAHQTALTQNRIVQVRFYQLARANMPGETVSNPATGRFRAMQCFQYDDAGNATQLDKVLWLPGTIIIDSSSTLSPLLGAAQAKTAWTTTNPIDPQVSLPTVGTSYNARVFNFQADGSTNLLPVTTTWFITLHNNTDGDNLTALPKNFFTLQIDALNGHVQNFRP